MSKCLCVHRVPLFAHLTSEEQDRIQKLLSHQTYQKGEIILSPETPEKLIIIFEGQIRVYRLTTSGKEQLLRISGAGDYEGESNLFCKNNEALYGEALKTTKVCIIYKRDFQRLLSSYPQIGYKLLQLNTKKMVQLEQQIQFLAIDKIEERLAFYLLDLNSKSKCNKDMIIPMPLKELATYLGTRPETLSRKLKIFEERKWIARSGRKVKILSMASLEEL